MAQLVKNLPVMQKTWVRSLGWKDPLTSLVAQIVKRLPTMWETQVRSLGQEDPLEKEIKLMIIELDCISIC